MSFKDHMADLFGKRANVSTATPAPVEIEHYVKGTGAETTLRIKVSQVPNRPIHIMLPHYDRVGPTGTAGDVLIHGLYVGTYRVFLRLSNGCYYDATFSIQTGQEACIDLSGVIATADAQSLPTPEKIPIAYLQRRKEHTCQFWAGTATNAASFYALFSEEAYYAIEDDDERDNADLSAFASSQNEWWYDHDFLGTLFLSQEEQTEHRLLGMSWSNEWETDLRQRAREAGLGAFNCIVQMGLDSGPEQNRKQIEDPKDVTTPDVSLTYLGEITFQHF